LVQCVQARPGIEPQPAVPALSPSWLGPERVRSADREIRPETHSQTRCTARHMICPLHWEGIPRFSLPRVLLERGRRRWEHSQRRQTKQLLACQIFATTSGGRESSKQAKTARRYGGQDHGRGKLASLSSRRPGIRPFLSPPSHRSLSHSSLPSSKRALPVDAQLQRPSELPIDFSSGAARIHPPNEDATLHHPPKKRSLHSRHRSNTKIAEGAPQTSNCLSGFNSGSVFSELTSVFVFRSTAAKIQFQPNLEA